MLGRRSPLTPVGVFNDISIYENINMNLLDLVIIIFNILQ